MSGVRREGQASLDRKKAAFRPSAPIILVAAAVVLIAIATDLSRSGLHPSLPAAITLPMPGPAPTQPGTRSDTEPPATVTPAAAEPTGSTTTTSPTDYRPPTTVSPSYPLGSSQPAGTGSDPAVGDASITAGPAPAGATTTRPASGAPSGGSEDSHPETSKDSTETVPPNYPVVTSSAGSTTTSTPTSSTDG